MKYWKHFVPGELVDVWRGPQRVGSSRIDDMNSDGTIIWLVDTATGTRTLHLDTEGITLIRRDNTIGRQHGTRYLGEALR